MLKRYRIIFSWVVTELLLLPWMAQAQLLPDCNPVPVIPPGGKALDFSKMCKPKHLLELLVNIYNWLLGFAGIIALLFIIWAGFRMLTFYISETPEKDLESAKLTLRRAVFGLFLVIVAYLFVNTLILVLSGGTLQITNFLGPLGL